MSGQGSPKQRFPPSTPPRDRFKRQPSSSSQPAPKIPAQRSASLPRILAGAAGLVASRGFILDTFSGRRGGTTGLVILGFWGSRLLGEIVAVRGSDRKGKRKAVEPAAFADVRQPLVGVGGADDQEMRDAVMFAGQSIAAFSTLSELGPLPTAVLGLIGGLGASTDPSDRKAILSLAPVGLAGAGLILRRVAEEGTAALRSPLAFLGFTFLACQCSNSPKTQSRTSTLRRTAMSFLLSTTFLAVLWIMGAVPSPFDSLVNPNSSLLVPLLIAGLCRYIPLPFSTSSSQRLERLRTSREGVVFLVAIVALQLFAFPPIPTMLELLLCLPLAVTSLAIHPAFTSKPPGKSSSAQVSAFTSSWSLINLLPLRWRSHLQTILHTPASRRMFYFLLLNLGYMGVQMGYGVITNSLGLISDAIHMLFDCLGLGVGLWASVAATWKPDERYTFGYTRVETLSGFANGCFLILISIFIIFEAIQRVISPPEMHIEQLLPVSSIGLAINLFGMWATGGHHHHGHGHSHGHDHGHAHHIPVHEKKEDHRHDSHSHSHHEQHHSHTHSPKSPRSQGHIRRRSSGLSLSSSSPKVTQGHSSNGHAHHDHHDHSHDTHEHTHSDCDDHSHSHSHDHGHSHNMRGVFLHVLADTLGSVGVIISTILIKYTGWTGFDPIASLFIAALILASVIPLVIDSGKVLCLDVGDAGEADIRKALADLAGVEGLANYGAPRFWPKSEGVIVGSIHIRLAVSPSSYDPTRFSTPHVGRGQAIYVNSGKVVARVEKVLKKNIRGLKELVIQVEGSEERTFCSCMAGGG